MHCDVVFMTTHIFLFVISDIAFVIGISVIKSLFYFSVQVLMFACVILENQFKRLWSLMKWSLMEKHIKVNSHSFNIKDLKR